MPRNENNETIDKGRKLTEEEIRRKEKLDALTEQLAAEGYTRKDLTVGMLEANIKGPLLALPIIICEIVIHILIHGSVFEHGWINISWFWIVIMLLLIVVHELIHGITWGIFAKNHMKDIKFGIVWKMLTPYCTCAALLKRHEYMIGGVMPLIILGFGLFAVSLLNGSFPLYFIALLMTLGACGDMLIFCALYRYKSDCQEILIYDHPYEAGCVVFER